MVVQAGAVSAGVRGRGVGDYLQAGLCDEVSWCLCPVVQQLYLSGAALGHDLWVISEGVTFSPPRHLVSFLTAFTKSLFCLN